MLIRNLGSFCEASIHEKVHFGGGGGAGRKKKGREEDEEKGEERGGGREGRRGRGKREKEMSDCMVRAPSSTSLGWLFLFYLFLLFWNLERRPWFLNLDALFWCSQSNASQEGGEKGKKEEKDKSPLNIRECQ